MMRRKRHQPQNLLLVAQNLLHGCIHPDAAVRRAASGSKNKIRCSDCKRENRRRKCVHLRGCRRSDAVRLVSRFAAMLADFTGADKVYLACGYTNLRRGIDGLASMVQKQFALDSFTNTLFLFCGRRRDRIKGLYWEGDGFLLLYKRLESGIACRRWLHFATRNRLEP